MTRLNILLGLIAISFPCSSAPAVVVTASTTGPTTVNVGDPVTIDLSISGWTDGEVDEVSLVLDFDQVLFTHTGQNLLTAGSFLDNNQQATANLVATPDLANLGGGDWGMELRDDDASITPPNNTGAIAMSGDLGSVMFSASAVGVGTFTPDPLSITFLEPFDANRFLFGLPITTSVAVVGQQITVVPEPSAFLFLGLAATGCCGYRWRKKDATV